MSGPFYRPATVRPPRTPRRPSSVPRIVGTLVLLAGLGGGTAWAFALVRQHPRFAVRRVVLSGVPEVRRAEVETITDAWIGQPLFRVDLDGAVASLSGRLWVARATARRVVPDTVVVELTVRAPVAVARRGEDLWTIDHTGSWLGPHAGGRGPADYVIIDPAGCADPRANAARGVAFLERLEADDPLLVGRLSEIEVLCEGFAVVDETGHVRLLFGGDALEPRRAAARWRAFLALAPELERHGLVRRDVDLRFDNRIVLPAPTPDGRREKT